MIFSSNKVPVLDIGKDLKIAASHACQTDTKQGFILLYESCSFQFSIL